MIKESKKLCSDKSPRSAQVQCLRWCYVGHMKEDVSLLLWDTPVTCSELPVVLMLHHKWPHSKSSAKGNWERGEQHESYSDSARLDG